VKNIAAARHLQAAGDRRLYTPIGVPILNIGIPGNKPAVEQ